MVYNSNCDMFVTIIMNTYKEDLSLLQAAIDSCLNQTKVDVQLIISTVKGDKNISWIKNNFHNIQLIITNKVNHPGRSVEGSFFQINAALPFIKGNWFHFISSNDILYHDKCFLEITKCKETGKKICYSNFNHINEAGERTYTTKFFEYDHAKHLTGNFVSDASLISADLIKKYAPFRTDLNNYGYWDLWLRIYEGEGNVFCFNPIPVFDYRVINSSMHIERSKNQKEIEITKKFKLKMLSLHK